MPRPQNTVPARAQSLAPTHCGNLADVIADMSLVDEGIAAGLRAQNAPQPTGYNLRGVVATSASIEAARRGITDRENYQALAPWVTVYEAIDNPAPETLIEFGTARAFYYSRRAGRYQTLLEGDALTGAVCAPQDASDGCREVTVRGGEAGARWVQFPTAHRFAGRWPAVSLDPKDITSLTVVVPMRVIGPNARQARYLARVGAEYYRQPGLIPASGPHAAAGVGRLRALHPHWRTVSFTTLADSGVQQPGSGVALSFLLEHPPPCVRDREANNAS